MASSLTLAFVGCGNMGAAILGGILDVTREDSERSSLSLPAPCAVSRFLACTKTAGSAEKLRTRFARDSSRVEVLHDSNVKAMMEADIIVLGCKPYLAEAVLSEPGVQEALTNKFLVSIVAGKTCAELQQYIQKGSSPNSESSYSIMRAIPNVAASVGESMTVIEQPAAHIPVRYVDVITWIFEQIGMVKFLAPDLMDVGCMMAGSSMAVLSLALDGILDGAVAEGVRRADAMEMAAQGLLGLSKLLKAGTHPAIFRETVSSPRGCTIQGLLTAEKAGVRGTYAQAIIDGTQHLQKLQKK
ncbi:hypothetical protein ASPZODRAFT_59196 [Penicilliopsis zonata CBS 506.65]|uniref:Pyrroline-5-carboxylate reductase n=1 Tax=Penicilliopsis zonata CBS 506.65 TaxID=1073090 RepID=A0A1L9SSV7_9EURO|nr:hypothetical protein ASPZODRAFT_59196 [Penicilliopsis zonata CBS 506.65]OJJ50285.1 hypothetical protein ASPZODRAFT_59196 [Penicilliopsis zonata CBS 506.65]